MGRILLVDVDTVLVKNVGRALERSGHSVAITFDSEEALRRVAGLARLLPGAKAKIVDVRLARWGHALCHGKPGWYSQRSPSASRPVGRVLFAYSDNQGLPSGRGSCSRA